MQSVTNTFCKEAAVGQLLMVSMPADTITDEVTRLFLSVQPGSIIFYASQITSAVQLKNLCLELSQLSALPLLFALDQEGGRVQRLHTAEFTSFPSARSLGETNDLNLIASSAQAMAKEIRAVGCHMTLAPVVDVDTHPLNPVIGSRAFGDTPAKVIRYAQAYLEGLQREEVLTCLKHFPGHGDTKEDSHYCLPTVDKSKEELEAIELAPFRALAAQSDAVMSAHVLLPQLDREHCATFSPHILGLLRQSYEGVIISDSLTMQGALQQTDNNLSEACILALNAGCDVLCIGGKETSAEQVIHAYQGLLRAVDEGRVSLERVEAAAKRVQRLKTRLPGPRESSLIGCAAHRAVVRQVAERSVRVVKQTAQISSLDGLAIFYSTHVKKALDTLQLSTQAHALNSEEPLSEPIAQRQLWVLYDAFTSSSTQAKLAGLSKVGARIFVIITGSFQDAAAYQESPEVEFIAHTYSPTPDAIRVALDKLCHDSKQSIMMSMINQRLS